MQHKINIFLSAAAAGANRLCAANETISALETTTPRSSVQTVPYASVMPSQRGSNSTAQQ